MSRNFIQYFGVAITVFSILMFILWFWLPVWAPVFVYNFVPITSKKFEASRIIGNEEEFFSENGGDKSCSEVLANFLKKETSEDELRDVMYASYYTSIVHSELLEDQIYRLVMRSKDRDTVIYALRILFLFKGNSVDSLEKLLKNGDEFVQTWVYNSFILLERHPIGNGFAVDMFSKELFNVYSVFIENKFDSYGDCSDLVAHLVRVGKKLIDLNMLTPEIEDELKRLIEIYLISMELNGRDDYVTQEFLDTLK